MTEIEKEIQYKATMERIEELLTLVTDDTLLTDNNLVELKLLSNLVADYDEANYREKSNVFTGKNVSFLYNDYFARLLADAEILKNMP